MFFFRLLIKEHPIPAQTTATDPIVEPDTMLETVPACTEASMPDEEAPVVAAEVDSAEIAAVENVGESEVFSWFKAITY